MKLTKDNLLLYAAQNYYNPKCIDSEEFLEDLKRFKYIKRLLNRYRDSGQLSERLILNHLCHHPRPKQISQIYVSKALSFHLSLLVLPVLLTTDYGRCQPDFCHVGTKFR